MIAMIPLLPICLKSEIINQPVVNIYVNPEDDTEVESQAIYGTSVEVIEKNENGWIKIKTIDNVTNCIKASQAASNSSYEKTDKLRPVKNFYAHVYRVTDTTPFPPLMTLPYGSLVKLEDTTDSGNRWVAIELVSGAKAWIQRGDIDFAPKKKNMDEVLLFSKKFMGLPYTWGGTSSYGFDCSGFVQMLFKEMGVIIPRNSRNQAASPLFVTVERKDLQPGDLVFFGTNRITHVGMYLGNDEFIHSGTNEIPVITINKLNSTNYNPLTAKRLAPQDSKPSL